MVETAKVTLVTVIATFELEDRFVEDLKALGVKGYVLGRVQGRGLHGARMAGLVDSADMRIEMLVSPTLAKRVLRRVVERYADLPILAFTQEVEAVPAEQFG
jgi:nitrogen regulatory protein P-II 2